MTIYHHTLPHNLVSIPHTKNAFQLSDCLLVGSFRTFVPHQIVVCPVNSRAFRASTQLPQRHWKLCTIPRHTHTLDASTTLSQLRSRRFPRLACLTIHHMQEADIVTLIPLQGKALRRKRVSPETHTETFQAMEGRADATSGKINGVACLNALKRRSGVY